MVSRPNPYVSKSLVNKQIVNKGYLTKTTPVSKKEELPKNLELAVRDLLAAIG